VLRYHDAVWTRCGTGARALDGARACDRHPLDYRALASMLQQRMGIGYNHASRIMHLFEKRGVVGPARGGGPREVLVNN